MTNEQIAKLRRHAEMQEECIDGKACSHTDELLRLLDEREELLAAAVHVRNRIERRRNHEWCRGEGDIPLPCGDAVALAEIKAAIAKAEAP